MTGDPRSESAPLLGSAARLFDLGNPLEGVNTECAGVRTPKIDGDNHVGPPHIAD
jgi:hypothetical protein